MVDAIILGAEEATRLCETLWDSVSLGPGIQNSVFAMPEVRASIERLRGEIAANDVSGSGTVTALMPLGWSAVMTLLQLAPSAQAP